MAPCVLDIPNVRLVPHMLHVGEVELIGFTCLSIV